MASITWDTTGYSGALDLYIVLDLAGQLAEQNENNNSTSIPVTVLARPDLRVTAIAPDGPTRQGMPVDMAVTVGNSGGSNAGLQTVSLYDGDPASGGIFIGSQAVAVAAGLSATVTISWTPAVLGPTTLYAQADSDDVISEFDESNNVGTQSAYVGWGDPVYVDAGTAGDLAYSPETGYGYLTAGTTVNCGTEPYQTYRRRNSGELLEYQFDHLLPARFYHLDLTFYLCTGADRQLRILLDGVEVATATASTSGPQTIPILLDPALYSDNSMVVAIEKTAGGLGGPVVSALKLSDIRYCYRDSGAPAEAAYAEATDGCGWLAGLPDTSWGSLPYRSVRYNEDANVQYRFDGLEAGHFYQLHVTLYEGDDAGRVEEILVDGTEVLSSVPLSSTAQYMLADVPPSAYTDGSILVDIVDISPTSQPVVSEIALEEKTVITELGAAQGVITLQGRDDHNGVVVTAWQGGVEVASTTTAANGSYTLPLLAGTYELTAAMERYLDSERQGITVTGGGMLNVPAVDLPGGDANDDDAINILDLTLIGSHFGFECGDPGWDPRADINDDCVVNILDLTITGGNFGETSPVPWP